MKNIKHYLRFLIREAHPLFAITFVLCLILIVIFFSLQIKFYNQETARELDTASIKAERAFLDILDYSQHIMNIMNSQIRNNPKNKQYISNIVQKYRGDPSLAHNFPWTLFSWIDKNNILIVDAAYGVMKQPLDLSNRDYVSFLRNNPNKLIIGKPVIGSTSKQWMIAGGVGAVDDNKNYIGAMTIGFKIKTLLSKLKSTAENRYVDIMLIYNNLNVVTENEVVDYKKYDFGISDKNFKKNLENFVKSKETIFTNIAAFDYRSNYKLKKIEDTDYILLVKYSNLAASKDLWMNYFGRIAELLIVAAIAFLMLYMIYQKERKQRFKIIIANRNADNANNSNISKTRLISIVSHDIKNYAFAISGLAKLFLEKKTKTEIQNDEDLQLIEYIASHSDELRYFVADLLDYQQRESGDFTLGKFEDCDMKILIKRMVLLNKNLALENKILVETNVADNIPLLKCDIRRFKQILTNLISNAIKYSPEGNKVEITVKYLKKNPKLYIEIKDYGFGMNEAELRMALLGEGANIDKSEFDKKIDSHGIGLTIVRKLVELHNGIMEIESEKGVGTIVRLRFDLDEAEQNQTNLTAQEHKNILLAEDNWVNTKVITAILKNTNCNVDCVRNGKEAIDMLNNNFGKKYHLILMDVEMPIMNGIEAIKIIRADEKFSNVPIITITSNSNDKILEEFGQDTDVKHLNKTSSKKEILDLIVQVLEESSLKY